MMYVVSVNLVISNANFASGKANYNHKDLWCFSWMKSLKCCFDCFCHRVMQDLLRQQLVRIT